MYPDHAIYIILLIIIVIVYFVGGCCIIIELLLVPSRLDSNLQDSALLHSADCGPMRHFLARPPSRRTASIGWPTMKRFASCRFGVVRMFDKIPISWVSSET